MSNKPVDAKGEMVRTVITWEFGIIRYELFYTEQINRNYTQYSVINHDKKEYLKIYIHT